ncbi:PerC family transcriptional regulator [Salmonella enterica]|nr:PerC family transcriptional regulator [Salmonella enterica subsp. diarizonae serovar 48:i:z]EDQ9400527.1 PerC family transcriptional regulator [Salmonella enterica]EDR4378496.1 PerC family transcriptional regulator [Salmonella enterica]EEG5735613.1 PerC family transcriptional regulator [Salmonella enterica]EEG6159492.1 PerC family transcriptional regulator [Salmonella enterica]
MKDIVQDEKAFQLEEQNLWRRAARRWLEVSDCVGWSDAEREYLARRRERCLDMAAARTRKTARMVYKKWLSCNNENITVSPYYHFY